VPFTKNLDVIQQAQSGTGKTATFCAGAAQFAFNNGSSKSRGNSSSSSTRRGVVAETCQMACQTSQGFQRCCHLACVIHLLVKSHIMVTLLNSVVWSSSNPAALIRTSGILNNLDYNLLECQGLIHRAH
jgi:superfamily II DNA/RNA helicase